VSVVCPTLRAVELAFEGPVFYWRGPSPYHFVTVPDDEADQIRALAPSLTYGWGCIPVSGRVGATPFSTSLFPKDGGYVVPIKAAVRDAEGLGVGDYAAIVLALAN
jgi:Domain of unknown function (DUF1905)